MLVLAVWLVARFHIRHLRWSLLLAVAELQLLAQSLQLLVASLAVGLS
jgi:hypothetical protein